VKLPVTISILVFLTVTATSAQESQLKAPRVAHAIDRERFIDQRMVRTLQDTRRFFTGRLAAWRRFVERLR